MKIHESAVVEEGAVVGTGTSIWHFAHIRSGAKIGAECILGHASYVDEGVVVGARVKIQNKVSIYNGVTIEDDVFIGPHVCFTNDLYPRAYNNEWSVSPTLVKRGASIGANSTIRCGVTIGEFSMVGAGSVVTKDIEPFTLVLGVPARVIGHLCYCGTVIDEKEFNQKGLENDPTCSHDPNLDLSSFA